MVSSWLSSDESEFALLRSEVVRLELSSSTAWEGIEKICGMHGVVLWITY